MKIKIFAVGGTIDKIYFDQLSEYQVGLPNAQEILDALPIAFEYEVESLLRKLASSGVEMSNIRVYYSGLSGKPRYGVTYGDYSSREAASAAMRDLPQVTRINKPYPRQAVRLR